MADFSDNNEVAQSARVTANRDVVTVPNMMKWLVQGKVFEAGLGAEDTAINSQASLDDTKASFALQAPANTTTLVIPILLKLSMVADGGALSNYQVAFTKPAGLCATALTLSGTALTSKHCLYRTNPAQTSQQATALSGDPITVSALVAADYAAYHFGHVIDAALTTGLVAPGEGPSNVHTFRFLEDGAPHILTSGAAMLVYLYTGTSDSTWMAYMQWAEVSIDDLL